jgi:hypothetical protein
MVVGWGEGLDQVAEYLNGLPDGRQLDVAASYQHVLRPLFIGSTGDILPYRLEGPGIARPPVEYFAVYVNAVQRDQIPALARLAMEAGPPEFTAIVHGEEYAWLYRVPDTIEQRSDGPTAPEVEREED